MGEARSDKVAVVAEVKEKLEAASGVLLTEYRGIDVAGMAELRRTLSPSGGEYKIYKNTLVRLAANELGLELDELLVGPTALAFVGETAEGNPGDPAAIAKTLRDYSKSNEALVIKGGLLEGQTLDESGVKALAELPSRDEMFADFAGSMEHMLSDFAGVLDSKLREFMYAMTELADKGGPSGAAASQEAETSEAAEAADDSENSDSEES